MDIMLTPTEIHELLTKRSNYRKEKSWQEADSISNYLKQYGIICIDYKDGSFSYTTEQEINNQMIQKIQKNKILQEEEKLKRNEIGHIPKGRHSKKKNLKRKKTNKRSEQFSEWIISKFGLDLLTSKHGVLDIAGGKGNISYHLAKFSIKCSLIDPMQLKLSEKKTKDILTNTIINYDSNLSIENFIELDFRISWLNRDILDGYKFNIENLNSISYKLDNLGIIHHKHLFDVNSDKCMELVRNASLIFGLHPDEATEDIVLAALKENVPFAVVPCCVFPTLFSNRIGKDGSHVRSLDQFLDYLQDKDDRIKREVITTLAEPNNKCLYFIPYV